MPLPSKVNWVTFDVYGTLIDWESGIAAAFEREAARDGFTVDRKEILPLFHEISREVEGGSYELYAEVLRRSAVQIAERIGWPLEPSRAGFLPDSLKRWMPFKETNAQLKKFTANFQTALISNIDDKLLGETRRHLPADFDLVEKLTAALDDAEVHTLVALLARLSKPLREAPPDQPPAAA